MTETWFGRATPSFPSRATSPENCPRRSTASTIFRYSAGDGRRRRTDSFPSTSFRENPKTRSQAAVHVMTVPLRSNDQSAASIELISAFRMDCDSRDSRTAPRRSCPAINQPTGFPDSSRRLVAIAATVRMAPDLVRR